ncbi:MAG: hypothetical protein EOP02_30705 [Proteobacteria bacterium]|nr:MAG: hypothetical protein EOP02_30705 [Pseudomonadota bacterium]
MEGTTVRLAESRSAGIRLMAYEVFLDALTLHPWTGYGWRQTVLAQFAVAPHHGEANGMFQYAHSVALDMLVWCGIPLGLAILTALAVWFARMVLAVKTGTNALLLMVLIVLGVHSMLEFPFAYGYFLWPAGIIAGVLNAQCGRVWFRFGNRSVLVASWLVVGAMTLVVVRDYLLAEESFRDRRFELNRVNEFKAGPVPRLYILTQLEALLHAGRTEAYAGMTDEEIMLRRDAFLGLSNVPNAFYLAKALAMNGQAEEARHWQLGLNRVFSPTRLKPVIADWNAQALKSPEMAKVPWPQP